MRNGFRVRVLVLLFLTAFALTCIEMIPLFAKVDFPGTAVPEPYFAVPDSGGANNGPGQKDLTQMGWFEDLTTPGGPFIDLFWSWDEITVSGNNTLDGCALFDNNNNTLIDFAVCATIERKSGQSAGMFLKAVTVYTCVDSRNDRCGGPTLKSYTAADIIGGGLKPNPLNNPPLANDELLTNTDPFTEGAGYPYDTTVRLKIRRAYLPANSGLTNVCSYPSQQPNSDPSDCNNPPGSGYLQIVKNAHETEAPYTNFTFNVTSYPSVDNGENNCPAGTPCVRTVTQQKTAMLSLLVGSASLEEVLPAGWSLAKSYCGADTGTATNPLNVTIDSGVIARCTFDNTRDSGTISIIKLVNDGGTFTLKIMSGATLIAKQDNVGNTGTLAATSVPTGSYTLSEEGYGATDLLNYTSTYSCTINGAANTLAGSGITIDVSVSKNDAINCTFTNTRISGYLQIIKNVINTADPEHKGPDAFQYNINGGAWVSFSAQGNETFPVDPSLTYTVTEKAAPGYTATYSNCTNITVASGQTQTCTITNTAQQAKPTGTTTMKWVLHDSLAISGIKGAAATATVNFRLYSNNACSTQVGSELNRPIVNGVAQTFTGVVVTSAGTYYWQATYSGDVYNEGFVTPCMAEVTQIGATYNQ